MMCMTSQLVYVTRLLVFAEGKISHDPSESSGTGGTTPIPFFSFHAWDLFVG